MKMRSFLSAIFVLVMIGFTFTTTAQTEVEVKKLTGVILHEDSLFWNAYNACDTANIIQFFTDAVEFYHDKGGITNGAHDLAASIKNNLCSNRDFKLRRKAVAASVKVYPLAKSNDIYGAILTGEHLFYITEKGKPEYLDGRAKFSHVWLLKNNTWKMARILSYDHGPAN